MSDDLPSSPKEWIDLLKPFGYPHIEALWSSFDSEPSRLRVMVTLQPSSAKAAKQNEWLVRTDLLMQAAGAVEAVKGAGFSLEEAPRIKLGGQYAFQAGKAEPEYVLDDTAGSVSMKIKKVL